MTLKHVAAATLLATTGTAFAAGGSLGTIDDTTVPLFAITSGAFFQDFYTFDITGPSTVSGEVLSMGIDPFVVTLISGLNTVASDTSADSFSFEGLAAGSYTLSFLGLPVAAASGYGGYVQATTVPEPETYALMLAGLGIVGFVLRRRSST